MNREVHVQLQLNMRYKGSVSDVEVSESHAIDPNDRIPCLEHCKEKDDEEDANQKDKSDSESAT